MVRLLRCLFVVMVMAVVCRAIDVPLCDRSLCSCPQPNGQIGDTVKVDDKTSTGCLCACGRAEFEACTTDDHCAKGTSCSYPKDLVLSGYQLACINKCALESSACGKYQRCSLTDDYEPVCNPRSFDCDPSVVASVAAIRGNSRQTFPNECEKVNANYELLVADPSADTWSATA